MRKSEYLFIFKIFFGWLIAPFLILFLAVKFVPLQRNFLGGGLGNYLSNPYFWSWGNFDGEHYTSIAVGGYGLGEYAFFPLYPILIRFVGTTFRATLAVFNSAGIFISLTAFFAGLIGFYKLIRIDYPEKVSKLALILLLLFPTSFYFAAIYTESLFFALAVWSVYFARRGKWAAATLFGILVCATRFVGLIVLPVVLIEWLTQNWKRRNVIKSFPFITLTIPVGFLVYAYYLLKKAGDPFAFFTDLSTFGEQRSSYLVTLPQVFYRYFFKILPNLHTSFFPILFTTYFELGIAILFLVLICLTFKKLRLSYWLFLVLGYLIPTFSGSFSSLPRYVLVLFPAYVVIATFLIKKKVFLVAFSFISFILLAICLAFFARGYWIS
jgi:hypothetical protein